MSHKFESFQSNWLLSKITNSGYSAEDLVSNLIGFYRAVEPEKPVLRACEPVNKTAALEIWDKYGTVGSNKNFTTSPYTYPTGITKQKGPMSISLPVLMQTISPAKAGVDFDEVK